MRKIVVQTTIINVPISNASNKIRVRVMLCLFFHNLNHHSGTQLKAVLE